MKNFWYAKYLFIYTVLIMSTYSFLGSRRPEIILTDDEPGLVSYEVADNRMTAASWGGVMARSVAAALRPWAVPVRLSVLAYRYGNYDWEELEIGQGIWGALFKGPNARYLAFALLDDGRPMITSVQARPELRRRK